MTDAAAGEAKFFRRFVKNTTRTSRCTPCRAKRKPRQPADCVRASIGASCNSLSGNRLCPFGRALRWPSLLKVANELAFAGFVGSGIVLSSVFGVIR